MLRLCEVEGLPAEIARSNRIGVLDPNDGLQGLTSREQLFVSLSFSGLNDSEAYRRSGDCSNMNQATIGKRAHEMAHLPKVQGKLRELQVARDKQSMLASNLSREWIQQRLMYLADNASKESVQVTALLALGKVVGIDLFRETTRVERIERTPADIDRELEEQLKSLAKTIEGSASVVNTSKPYRKPGKMTA